jgi:hypothetical protein
MNSQASEVNKLSLQLLDYQLHSQCSSVNASLSWKTCLEMYGYKKPTRRCTVLQNLRKFFQYLSVGYEVFC